MHDLIRLPDGHWIDPGFVTSIKALPAGISKSSVPSTRIPDRVVVSVDGGQTSELDFTSFSAAEQWADEFGKQVNFARGGSSR